MDTCSGDGCLIFIPIFAAVFTAIVNLGLYVRNRWNRFHDIPIHQEEPVIIHPQTNDEMLNDINDELDDVMMKISSLRKRNNSPVNE
jgi:hypothetical protein